MEQLQIATKLGTFAHYPPVFYLAVGGPIILFVVGYLLSDAFRGFVRTLVGDPWGITALQTYRVLGVSMAIQALRNALPAVFGLPAGRTGLVFWKQARQSRVCTLECPGAP